MMCGGGSVKEGSKGAGGDDFSMMQIIALYEYVSRRRHPTAATGPHSWQKNTQQSANTLGACHNSFLVFVSNNSISGLAENLF